MNFIAEIFSLGSSSNKGTGEDIDNPDDDFFFDIFDDITKTARTKLSWCMFKVRQYQRRRYSQPHLNERRKMYDPAFSNTCSYTCTIASNGNNTRSNGIPKSLSDNVILENKATFASRLYGTNDDLSDDVVTKSSVNLRGSSADYIWKNAINDMPRSVSHKSPIKTHPNLQVPRNDVTDRVATKLAARRKDIAGMTSSQRVAYFRNKYSIVKT